MKTKEDNVISLDKDEVIDLCKPGEGDNTCIWLMVGSGGFECCYYSRPTGLVSRWNQGLTTAKRNGCDVVRKLDLDVKYTEATTLEEEINGEYNSS